MNHQELQNYLNAQLAEIEKYKWIESERRHHDIGFDAAAMEWIHQYSDSFRNYWLNDRRAEHQHAA